MPEPLKKFSAAVLEDFKKALASQPAIDLVSKTKAADAAGTFKVIISTSDEDRQGDTVDQTKWKLQNFEANPVVLWAHDYYSLPIGVCTKIGVEGGKLVAEGKFADATLNPFAAQVAALYEAGFIKTTSVGYMQHEDGSLELLEFSFVPVPANPYALSMRQMKALKLNMPQLVMKGIQFEAKAEVAGDPCTMPDGTTGVLAEDKDNPGQLVCVPEEKSVADETALVKALKTEHTRHAEGVAKAIDKFDTKSVDEFKSALAAENNDHLEKCMKAIDDNYELQDQKKSIEDFKSAFTVEHGEHVKCFDKAIEESKSVEEFEKAAGAELQRHEKAQMDLAAQEMGRGEDDSKSADPEPEPVPDIEQKSGRAISAANKERIRRTIKMIEDFHAQHTTEHEKASNDVIAALKDLMGPDEGNEGEEQKPPKAAAAPKPKVEVRDILQVTNSFEAFMTARKVLRTVDAAVGKALEDLNKHSREKYPNRR